VVFDGTETRKLQSFRVQWDLIDRHLESLGCPPFNKLTSLKKCVKGMALRTTEFLPGVDASYEIAIETLHRNNYNNQSNVQVITRDMQNHLRMENKLTNMHDFYSRFNVIHQSIQALKLQKTN